MFYFQLEFTIDQKYTFTTGLGMSSMSSICFLYFSSFKIMVKLKAYRLLLFIFVFASANIYAQHRFIENGGQWVDNVKFRTDIPGGKIYFETDRFTFDLYDVETTSKVFSAHAGNPDPMPPPKNLNCHAYQMIFLDGNGVSSGQKPFETNYSFFIGDDPNKWAGNLKGYEAISYAEIYPGIDLKVYSNSALKYDFIVRPGAQPQIIQIEYAGVKPKINAKGQIEIKTSVGQVLESKPFAYQVIDGEIRVVQCRYILNKNILSFEIGEYNFREDLIIDPEMIFSTFSGSYADNFGYSATYDNEGHLYSGSSSFGSGYPFSIGAYQTAWAGGQGNGNVGTDVAVSKFSLDGTALVYSTYLGGSKDELPHSLIVNDNNELYLFGTTSSSNFPTTANAVQSVFAGGESFIPNGIGVAYINGSDIFVSRLSANGGSLLASTYLGGENNDGLNTAPNLKQNYADEMRGEIEFDIDGNVIIGSNTYSADFPMTASAFQSVKAEGQDGVLVRLNPNLTQILSSTFFGGDAADAIYSIHATPNGNITVGGGTSSQNLPSTPSAYQPAYAGGTADGFIAEFDPAMESIVAMTYYGSSAYDQIYFVERDEMGNPHVYGQTRATGNTLIENADFSIPNSGMLLSSFAPDLQSRIWSTVFGNGQNVPSLSPTAFSVDICNRIYLSGWGGVVVNGFGGTAGLPLTDDAIQTTTDNNDFYFMVLDGDANGLTFATYFGGASSYEHVDGGTSRFDKSGKIYQAACAGCPNNDDWPIHPDNAYSPTNNSNNCNLGVVKIDFDLPIIFADFEAQPVCIPDSVYLENTSNSFSGSNPFYKWVFPNGDVSFQENLYYTFDAPGIYDIQLIITEPDACNISDTIVKSVQVYPEIEIFIPDTLTSCDHSNFTVISNAPTTYSWYKWSEDPDFNTIISEGAANTTLTYTAEDDITLYLHTFNGLCERVDSVFLSPLPDLHLSLGDTLLCSVQELEVSVSLSGNADAADIHWYPNDNILSGQGTQNVLLNAFETFTLSTQAHTEFGCDLKDSIRVTVNPIFLETVNDTLSCNGEPIDLTANSNGMAESFLWSKQSDFSQVLNPSGDSTITVIPIGLTYYYVMAINGGCSLIDSVAVSLLSAGTTISSNRYICAGDTASISVTNDFPGSVLTHHWEPEEYIISGQGTRSIKVSVTEPTTFLVESSTPEGCVVENSTTVYTSNLGNLEIDASANPPNIALGESSIITATPNLDDYTYQWDPSSDLSNPNSPTSNASPKETTTYKVNIIDAGEFGVCIRTDSVTIFVFDVICGEPNIFVPNSFTPNGDGENDEVWVRGGDITDLEFSIFNRWGELVFETRDQSIGWDGSYNGKIAEPAVYVYHLRVRCGDGQNYFTKGNITLIR